MLGRTANDLFWLSRYMERAENMARLIEVGYRIVLLPREGQGFHEEWRSTLLSTGCAERYEAKFGQITTRDVVNFLLFDPENPSSIYSCLAIARRNARAQRTSLTREMWESLNSSWIEFSAIQPHRITSNELPGLLDWIKERSALFRGTLSNTILRNDTFYFSQLGAFLERADNTARILDVKYHSLAGAQQSQADDLVDATDFYHWGALLRSVSAFEVYRKVYRDVITPERVAELLILREDLPRALHSCMEGVVEILDKVRNSRSDETLRRAGQLYAVLRYGRMDDIFERGLHAWLDDFIDSIGDLGVRISEDFLVGA